MKDISIYFQPIELQNSYREDQLGSVIDAHTNHFPDLSEKGCAIVYVPEYRGVNGFNSEIEKAIKGPSNFREEFYALYKGLDF